MSVQMLELGEAPQQCNVGPNLYCQQDTSVVAFQGHSQPFAQLLAASALS